MRSQSPCVAARSNRRAAGHPALASPLRLRQSKSKMRTFSLFTFVAGAALVTGVACAQTAADRSAFDVASVKPAAPLDMAKLAADAQAGKMPKLGARIEGS